MALIMVMAALAVIALVAARFAQRIDDLRDHTRSLREHAEQSLQATNALAATLYVATTRRTGPGGFGPPLSPELRADDRLYGLPDGGLVRLQDQRGLLPLGAVDRVGLSSVLRALGVAQQDTDAFVDVLEDYMDTDSLKRLNGAEAPEYASAGLPAPRNDFITTVGELGRMPRWRDAPAVTSALEGWASPSRQALLNPNTAPVSLMAAWWPWAPLAQLELLGSLRAGTPFQNGAQATRATGLALDRDDLVFHVSARFRITVSAVGSPRALQYNVTLTPGGREAPWLISHIQAVPRVDPRTLSERAEPFPLAFTAAR
jgi:Type II secretion system (T2SS), protein K